MKKKPNAFQAEIYDLCDSSEDMPNDQKELMLILKRLINNMHQGCMKYYATFDPKQKEINYTNLIISLTASMFVNIFNNLIEDCAIHEKIKSLEQYASSGGERFASTKLLIKKATLQEAHKKLNLTINNLIDHISDEEIDNDNKH